MPDSGDALEQGRAVAEGALNSAPSDPIVRVRWARGFDSVDVLRAAIDQARAAGVEWRAIAEALGEAESTVRVRYNRQSRRRRGD